MSSFFHPALVFSLVPHTSQSIEPRDCCAGFFEKDDVFQMDDFLWLSIVL